MTANSDDRREVAARLRDDNHGYGTEYDFFLHALGMSREGRGPCDWNKVHKRLADLIDPTCHNADDGVRGGFVCSECGYHVEQDTMDADFNAWEDLRHCPHCGARVVNEDGD